MTDVSALIERLEKAKFSGTLELRLESGEIASAELHHFLANTEFLKPLPTIEDKKDESSTFRQK